MKIKSITAFVTKAGGDDEKASKSFYKEYNENGDLIVETRYNDGGEIVSKTINEYNEKHQMVFTNFYDTEQESTEERKMEYSPEGRLTKEIIDFGQGYLSIFAYDYSNGGKTIKIFEQDEEGEVEETKLQELDANHNLISETVFNDEGRAITKTENFFDHNQKIIKKEESDLRYKTVQIHEYYYNESGQLTGVKTVNQKGKMLNWIKLEFDDQQRPVMQKSMSGSVILIEYHTELSRTEKHIDPHGNQIHESTIELNEKGNILKEYSPDSETVYEYEYYNS